VTEIAEFERAAFDFDFVIVVFAVIRWVRHAVTLHGAKRDSPTELVSA
jgi:hypothetical protein